jgi:hypothetical protein
MKVPRLGQDAHIAGVAARILWPVDLVRAGQLRAGIMGFRKPPQLIAAIDDRVCHQVDDAFLAALHLAAPSWRRG